MTTSTEMIVGSGRVLSSTYEWVIDNYSSYSDLETGKHIHSPTFNAINSLWYLRLYPNGLSKTASGCISLFLMLEKTELSVGKFQVQFTFTCLDNRGEVIGTLNTGKMYTISSQHGCGKPKFVNKSLLGNNASDNTLNKITIVCEVILKEVKSYKRILKISPSRIQHFKKSKTLKKSKFSDVKFIVQNKDIFAHKMILAANSSVFAAMFEHKTQENEENNITIEDISYKVFNELLSFVYTGKCTLSEDILTELFEAADKYQLLKLKDVCEEELCKTISINNVIAFLQLADMHSAKHLKKKAIDFIVIHEKEIIDRPEFDLLQNLHVDLFKDVFEEVLAHIN